MNLIIERKEEDLLSFKEQEALKGVLDSCFPQTFQGRIYFKQLPNFRFLGKRDDRLIGQVGITHRIVRLGNDPIRIFGIIDLCVIEKERHQGVGGQLLNTAINAAHHADVDFILLCADNQNFYRKFGFVRVENSCSWLAIDEHKTLGIQTESLADCLMVLSLKQKVWDDTARLDFLGYLF